LRRIAVALIHHPVLDRSGAVVTTAITNLDLHDIARSAYCYGLSDYFVVHPVAAQRELAERVRNHWVEGSGARRIPDRRPPMERLRVVASLDAAVDHLSERAAADGSAPDGAVAERHARGVELWTTSAAGGASVVRYDEAKRRLGSPGPSVLLLFGTGWGLAPGLHDLATVQLEPIASARTDGFNHLSVRAAAAITFDRLLAAEWNAAHA
jgi:hypothetical protein